MRAHASAARRRVIAALTEERPILEQDLRLTDDSELCSGPETRSLLPCDRQQQCRRCDQKDAELPVIGRLAIAAVSRSPPDPRP
jgi:hypothetical protein